MKVIYWSIMDPKGKVWMNRRWESPYGENGARSFLRWNEEKTGKKLEQEGYKVTRCYEEINMTKNQKKKIAEIEEQLEILKIQRPLLRRNLALSSILLVVKRGLLDAIENIDDILDNE